MIINTALKTYQLYFDKLNIRQVSSPSDFEFCPTDINQALKNDKPTSIRYYESGKHGYYNIITLSWIVNNKYITRKQNNKLPNEIWIYIQKSGLKQIQYIYLYKRNNNDDYDDVSTLWKEEEDYFDINYEYKKFFHF